MSPCCPRFVLVVCSVALVKAAKTSVELPFGTVSGNLLTASKEFLGIPFAPKPARFASAQLWSERYDGGHLEAKNYSAQCLQNFIPGAVVPSHATFSEDCLFLTIYTPREDRDAAGHASALKEEDAWPVMVWIHGGAFTTGSAMATNYNASVLAARGRVVVVGMNYRLGVLGFASVSAEDGIGTISNQGLRDQRVAMSWVRKHIGAFGGDAARITIFGESSGGDSVAFHVVSKGSSGLFDQAIMQSGGIFIEAVVSLEDSQHSTNEIAVSVGCVDAHDLTCLQQVPGSKILAAAAFKVGFCPVVDGDLLKANPAELVSSGTFNRVPFIAGTMLNEGNGFVYPPSPINASVFQCVVQTVFGAKASALLNKFRPSQGNDNRPQLSQLMTDMLFLCPTRKLSLALAKSEASPWAYVFDRHPKCAFLEQVGFGDEPGAPHGDDVQYVFDNFKWLASDPPNANFPGGTTCVPAPEDLLLADKVVDLWAGFAKHGKAPWPRFETEDERALKIDVDTVAELDTEIDHGRSECELIDSLRIGPSFFMPVFMSVAQCGGSSVVVLAERIPEQEHITLFQKTSYDISVALATLFFAVVIFILFVVRRHGLVVSIQNGEQHLLAA